jgi:hypothetical protein
MNATQKKLDVVMFENGDVGMKKTLFPHVACRKISNYITSHIQDVFFIPSFDKKVSIESNR